MPESETSNSQHKNANLMGKVQNYLAKLDQATIYGEKYKKK